MVITASAAYAAVKFWLPIVTATSLAIKGFLMVKDRITVWANTFLGNHMHHIQDAAERTATSVAELTSYHKNSSGLQKKMLDELSGMRADSASSSKEMLTTQHT